jgi:hypothetical protein
MSLTSLLAVLRECAKQHKIVDRLRTAQEKERKLICALEAKLALLDSFSEAQETHEWLRRECEAAREAFPLPGRIVDCLDMAAEAFEAGKEICNGSHGWFDRAEAVGTPHLELRAQRESGFAILPEDSLKPEELSRLRQKHKLQQEVICCLEQGFFTSIASLNYLVRYYSRVLPSLGDHFKQHITDVAHYRDISQFLDL